MLYVAFGLAWLILSFCQWRDLLRVQFWIGGVIFLGMLEMVRDNLSDILFLCRKVVCA